MSGSQGETSCLSIDGWAANDLSRLDYIIQTSSKLSTTTAPSLCMKCCMKEMQCLSVMVSNVTGCACMQIEITVQNASYRALEQGCITVKQYSEDISSIDCFR
jgi:hypothetical protein